LIYINDIKNNNKNNKTKKTKKITNFKQNNKNKIKLNYIMSPHPYFTHNNTRVKTPKTPPFYPSETQEIRREREKTTSCSGATPLETRPPFNRT
jgi:hypothetical protein